MDEKGRGERPGERFDMQMNGGNNGLAFDEKQFMFQFMFRGLNSDGSEGNAVFAATDALKLIYASEKFYNILGYDTEEYENHALLFLRQKLVENNEYVLRKVVRASKTKEPVLYYPIETATKGGSAISLLIGIRFMEKIDNVSYYYVTMKNRDEDSDLNRQIIEGYLNDSDSYDNHAFMQIKVGNLDHIMDNYGGEFRNAMLGEVSSVIHSTFRSSDCIQQISDDEFLVFMKDTTEQIASRKAEDLIGSISRLYGGELEDTEIYSNIGLAYYPVDGMDYETLFAHVDTAATYAAREGKNRVCAFEDDMEVILGEHHRNQYFEPDELLNKLDMGFLTFAFLLLSDAKDMSSSVNLLLERIGNHFDLSEVAILDEEENSQRLIRNNYWRRGFGVQHDDRGFSYPDSGSHNNIFTEDVCCLEDIAYLPEEFREFFHKGNIKSFVCCNYCENNLGKTHVLFSDAKRKRNWSTVEKNTLQEVGRLISVFSHLQKKRMAEKDEIVELRNHDQLTGLFNKRAFLEAAEHVIRYRNRSAYYAFIYTDMNGFDYINGNFGFAAGDKILCDYADVLRRTTECDLCCRVYSDIFLCLFRSDHKRDLLDKIKDINYHFLEEQRKNFPLNNLSVATGVYYINEGDSDQEIQHLVENANMARKVAKAKGGTHTVVYEEGIRHDIDKEREIAGRLSSAMSNGEIEMFLQPKFNLDTRKVIGAEALVRWRRADNTYEMPSNFIPILEKIGFIIDLDFYIFELVLKNMKKWRLEGKQLVPISVNFSRVHAQKDDFVKRIVRLCDFYEIDPKLIEIEITESTLSTDANRMISDMAKLQKAGFKVDLDDFGTGYSSLDMLLHAPIDIVKVDKSFLKDITDSKSRRDYLNCVAQLIGTAKKDIIFEGVETESQARILSEFGYDQVQGFLFGKPVSVDEFEYKYLTTNITQLQSMA